MRLRALSLWRPYAPAVAAGLKRIECRQNWTSHRGDLAIHAAKKCAPDGEPIWDEVVQLGPGGVVVAVVSLVACVHMRSITGFASPLGGESIDIMPSGAIWLVRRGSCVSLHDQLPFGRWEPGMYGYLFDAIRPLRDPVEVRGMPGIWTLTGEQTDQVYDQL